ncbi:MULTISPECIES: hypothetical protein [Pseudomonas]|uniref:hypothetical protein n=1 Tax=Pseudomonas TaxID=286 RepID=UPI002362F19B|nr:MULTISPECIES: hypothetical protein [Pseudomonas]WJV25582.1 hypothetical protein PSR66_05955 [Pseudomonas chlororaphis]
MSEQNSDTERLLRSRVDNKTGSYRFTHTLTPASQTDTVKLQLPPTQEGLAIYPLRYAILEHVFQAEQLPTLDVSGYADLGSGYSRGVRELRPRTHLYLFYIEDSAFKNKHYIVTDEVQFAEVLPPVSAAQSQSDDSLSMHEFPAVSAAHAYITAPLPTADRKLGDIAYLLACDTVLTDRILEHLEQDKDGIRTQTTTAFKLKGGTQQSHVLAIDDLKKVPALKDDERIRLELVEWSESQPEDMLGDDTIIKWCKRASASRQYAPVAIALHDPVGVMSEMGHLTGKHILELQEWSEREQVPRKVLVSKWIDQLGEQKARSVELEAYKNDAIGSSIPAGVGGGAANAARDRAYRAGLKAKAERLAHARNDERRKFMATYEQKRQTFIDAIDNAAAMANRMYSAVRQRHDAVMKLFDETDAESFISLRRAVTFSLSVLACDQQGRKVLEDMLPESGPTGLMERALMGYPDFSKVINETSAQQATMLLAGKEAERVVDLLAKVPADDASRYLGGVIAQLVIRGRLRSTEAFRRSTYYLAFQLLDGSLVGEEAVPLSKAGRWLLEANGGNPVHGFRPVTIARQANELIYLFKSQPIQDILREQRDGLSYRVNFWHGLRFTVGVTGLVLSTQNLQAVLAQLEKGEGEILVHSLNLASGLLVAGSGLATLGETGYQWSAGHAATNADKQAAQALEQRAKRYGNWAVGLLALSAAAASIKEFRKALQGSSPDSTAAHAIAGTLQASAATVGGLHLTSRLAQQNNKLGMTAIAVLDTASVGTGAIARGARAALAITRLGSGPIGWILLGLEIATTVYLDWHERNAEEEKITDWIARSIWGTGMRTGWLGGATALTPFDSQEEATGFYHFFMAPHIETDVAVLRTMGSVLIPGWGLVNRVRHGTPMPQDARTVTIALPGWLPQVGRYEVVQHNEFRFTGVQRTLNDPDQVVLRNGVGYVTYPTDTLGGDIKVKYWPNSFAEPHVVLETTKE